MDALMNQSYIRVDTMRIAAHKATRISEHAICANRLHAACASHPARMHAIAHRARISRACMQVERIVGVRVLLPTYKRGHNFHIQMTSEVLEWMRMAVRM